MTVVQRTVVLPMLPKSKNVYDAWQPMWKNGHRQAWMSRLEKEFGENQFPLGARRVVCHARLVFGSQRRRDWQNYVHPLWNLVADALVRFGAIPDDTPEFFSVGPDGGIVFEVDRRRNVPAKAKQRTVLGFAFDLEEWHGRDGSPRVIEPDKG